MRTDFQPPATSFHAGNAGRGALLNMGPCKRVLIRAFELIALPFLALTRQVNNLHNEEETEGIRKILVLEYWGLGDTVIPLPFLHHLRRHYPQAQISWMVNPKVVPLLENQGLVDEFIPVNVPWAQHFARWKKYNPFSTLWLQLLRTLVVEKQFRERDAMAMDSPTLRTRHAKIV